MLAAGLSDNTLKSPKSGSGPGNEPPPVAGWLHKAPSICANIPDGGAAAAAAEADAKAAAPAPAPAPVAGAAGGEAKAADTKAADVKAAPAAPAAAAKENEPTEEENAKEMDAIEADLRASGLIRDRRQYLSSYPKCFVASEAVSRWVEKKFAVDRAAGVKLGQRLYDDARIHHVQQHHRFKDEDLWFRFVKDEANANAGPSLAKLLATEDNVCHTPVLMSGTWKYSKCYAVLSREQKKLFLYETDLSASPKRVIDLSKCKYSVSECGACKTGYYCLKLNGCEGVNVLCVETSQVCVSIAVAEIVPATATVVLIVVMWCGAVWFDNQLMDKWTHGLVQAGVASLEDENDEKALKSNQMPSNFFEFTATDIDLKPVDFKERYAGKVCLVVNVASQ